MRILTLIILVTLYGSKCYAQTFSVNQVRQIQALMKPNDDWAAGQITWLRVGKTKDSLRINDLEKRVKALEDINKKYKYILEFDTSSIGGFKSTPIDTVRFLMQIRKQ